MAFSFPPYVPTTLAALSFLVQVCVGALLGALSALLVAPLFARQSTGGKPDGRHWTELAREQWEMRQVRWMAQAIIALFCVALGKSSQLSELHVPWPVLMAVRFAIALFVFHVIFNRLTLGRGGWRRASWRSMLAELVVFAPRLTLATIFVLFMPQEASVSWVLLHASLVLLSLRGGDLALARLLGLARPAAPLLQVRLDAVAERLGLAPVSCWEISAQRLKTLSWPSQGIVAVTSNMLARLKLDDVVQLCAGELAQFTEPRLVRWSRLSLRLVPWLTVSLCHVVVVFDFYLWLMLPLIWGLALLVWHFLQAILMRGDMHADASVHTHGGGRRSYVLALVSQFQLELRPVVLPANGGRFGHLYDGLVACGVDPGYARPRPPSLSRLVKPLLLVAVSACGVLGAFELLGGLVPAKGWPAAVVRVQMATFGINAERLTVLAQRAEGDGAYADALLVYRDLLQLSSDDAAAHLAAAFAASKLRRCELAESLWTKAESILSRRDDAQDHTAATHAGLLAGGATTSQRARVAVAVLACAARDRAASPAAH